MRMLEFHIESLPLEHNWPNGGRNVYFFDQAGNQGEFMTVDRLENVENQYSNFDFTGASEFKSTISPKHDLQSVQRFYDHFPL